MNKKAASNRIDMTGKMYNSWRVASYSHTHGKITFWNCECLECGTFYKVDGRNLRQGLSKRCIPCGHLTGHEKQKGSDRLKGKNKENAIYRYLLYSYKKSANSRGISISLSIEDIKALIHGNCEYCGTEPQRESFPMKYNGMSLKNTSRSIIRNGIDRIDSSKGYVTGNVVSCCTACNKAKMEMSRDEFVAWIKRLALHMGLLKP